MEELTGYKTQSRRQCKALSFVMKPFAIMILMSFFHNCSITSTHMNSNDLTLETHASNNPGTGTDLCLFGTLCRFYVALNQSSFDPWSLEDQIWAPSVAKPVVWYRILPKAACVCVFGEWGVSSIIQNKSLSYECPPAHVGSLHKLTRNLYIGKKSVTCWEQ